MINVALAVIVPSVVLLALAMDIAAIIGWLRG
jgi:hypothetical protein